MNHMSLANIDAQTGRKKKQCKFMVKNNPEIVFLEHSFNSSAQFQRDFPLYTPVFIICAEDMNN